jgi:hypothetical protein
MSICAAFSRKRGMGLGTDDFFILHSSNVYGEVPWLGVRSGT